MNRRIAVLVCARCHNHLRGRLCKQNANEVPMAQELGGSLGT